MLLVILFSLAFSVASSTDVSLLKCISPAPFCAPTCANPTPNCENSSTKACKEGYVYNKKGGKCIKIEDCPCNLGCNGDKNAIIKSCPSPCPPTCDKPKPDVCLAMCLPVGCSCKDGYLLSSEGKCIKQEKCPAPPTEKPDCKPDCIPTCAEPNPKNCEYNSKYSCKSGYVLSEKNGKCIKIEDCPTCLGCNGDKNAVIKSCPSPCPPTCDKPKPEICAAMCLIMGCSCKDGYLLSAEGKCIKKENCPVPPKPDCIPTCAEPNPKDCENNSKYSCESGYVLSEKNGKCIKIEDCPQDLGCNGDSNAVIKSCPPPCPSTCSSPNEFPCRKACLEKGCACKYGYLFDDNGKCVKPEKCSAGYPCGKNETFMGCRVECPDAYCSKDDSRGIIACDPPFPCPSGCVCELGYRRTNTDDRSCILAEDCPPICCTRDNEVYAKCPECLAESCADKDKPKGTCNTLVHNCNPQCICEKNYFRNDDDVCVPRDCCPCSD